ncbi:MAG: DNA polymerase IV [Coriobacteriales bacterium]|jgi:DNA polymerase-4|nr:DNA polymerase IV [Coriobacteriales bacterium]
MAQRNETYHSKNAREGSLTDSLPPKVQTGSLTGSPLPPKEQTAALPAQEGSLPSSLPPWEGPAILLVDLDAFFASVEQLDHPEWRGKPLIVGGDANRRGVVSTCSYEARTFGVRSAMASSTAQRLCPTAIWVSGNLARYGEVSRQVMTILESYSPRIQQVSIDEAFIDVSPGRFVKEHPVVLAQKMQEHVATLGVTCSIGVGTSKTIAKIASDQNKPQGLTVVYPGRELDFLAPLPVRDMSGIGRKAEQRLHDLGITTLADLAAADEELLKGIFGKNAFMIRERACGRDATEVSNERDVKSVSNEVTFSTNVIELAEIKRAIAMIAAKVARRLRRKELKGYTVTLKARHDDLTIHTAQRTLERAVDDEADFIGVLYELVSHVWRAGDELRLIGVGVSSFDARPEQMSLFGEEVLAGESAMPNKTSAQTNKQASHSIEQHKHDRSLVEATDKVKNRFGENAVRYGRELRFDDRKTNTIAQESDDVTPQQ